MGFRHYKANFMTKTKPTILWDFDGTLASSPGLWSRALLYVLDAHVPGHDIKIEQIRPFVRNCFPWDAPDIPHPHLSAPGAWWKEMEFVFARAYQGLGLDGVSAGKLAGLAHKCYVDAERFTVFDDVVPVLSDFNARGWQSVILSNHVPELPEIVKTLPFAPFIKECITSATIGYEKPHKEAYKIALEAAGNPEIVWMVGDSPNADVAGAEAVGIPAILVRTTQTVTVKYYAPDLRQAAAIILSH
jgi:putative hydrolase of the HAD superfamily